MNKKELIAAIAQRTGITKKDAGIILNAFLDTVTEALVRGEKVSITGFGSFNTVDRAARECRNPQTGETVFVDAKRAPKFKAGKDLKDAVA